jgi:biofilm PGA synthesis N-glycosyltransferase PgaC
MTNAAYLVITPVRNEIEHLEKTINSVASQTIIPKRWVLVDDGSTDGTRELIDGSVRKHSWIRAVYRVDRGFRKAGGGVVDAFYDGYNEVGPVVWDYIVKLDGDLSFAPDYFERCFTRFEKDTKLGVGGGTICKEVDGQLTPESAVDPVFHVRGATKIYRRQCWEGIGGLIRAPGWDTVDEVKANMLGWTTCSFPEIWVHHHRPAGQADGVWKDWVKNGLANYIAGYHPLFMLFKCISRLRRKPYAISSIGLLSGFLSGYVKRVPQIEDHEYIKYFQQQQIRRLTMRKNLWSRRQVSKQS